MFNYSIYGNCYRCKQKYVDEVEGQIMQDDEECHIWYCQACVDSLKAKARGEVDSCQWCKKPLDGYKVKLPNELILMHINCYETILESKWVNI